MITSSNAVSKVQSKSTFSEIPFCPGAAHPTVNPRIGIVVRILPAEPQFQTWEDRKVFPVLLCSIRLKAIFGYGLTLSFKILWSEQLPNFSFTLPPMPVFGVKLHKLHGGVDHLLL